MTSLKRIVIGLLIAGLLIFGITQGMIWSTHARDDSAQAVDYVIILGAKLDGERPMLALQYRLETALAYLERHPSAKVICSGGQGRDEVISEAAAMSQWLEKKGIKQDRILLEDQSYNTFENFLYSARLIELDGGSPKVAIATSGYHLYRARLLAKRHGLEPILLAAKTPRIIWLQAYLRETLALIKSYFLDR